jgi:hypothetical protein
MRIAIIADIHGKLSAPAAVLANTQHCNVDCTMEHRLVRARIYPRSGNGWETFRLVWCCVVTVIGNT